MTGTAVAAPQRTDGRRSTVRRYVALIVRIGLAAVWMWAGLAKVVDPASSVRAVRAYRLFPEWGVHLVAYGLPYLEITLAVLLLVGLGTRLGAIVSAVLLALFVAGVASAGARGLKIDCGCFGGGGTVDGGQTHYTTEILRDVGLLLVSAALAVWPSSRYSVDEAVERNVAAADPSLVRVGPRRTKEAQRRLADLVDQRRREGQRRLRWATAAAAVVLVAVAAIGFTVTYEQNKPIGNIAVPAGAVGPHGTSGIQFGAADAKVTLDVYEDFQCPVCQAFEAVTGQDLKTLYGSGQVRVRYHPLAFLNHASTTDYSSRSANVAACAADSKVFPAVHDQLFGGQPKEGTAGLSDDQMIELARGVGAVEKAFVSCVAKGKYNDWVNAVTEAASKAGITGTPTVLVNGKRITEPNGAPPSPDTLLKVVNAAKK